MIAAAGGGKRRLGGGDDLQHRRNEGKILIFYLPFVPWSEEGAEAEGGEGYS